MTDEPEAAEYMASGYIQWKGSNICLDVHCTCGKSYHVDAEFCYAVRCGSCGKEWALSPFIRMVPNELGALDDGEEVYVAGRDPQMIELREDEGDEFYVLTEPAYYCPQEQKFTRKFEEVRRMVDAGIMPPWGNPTLWR